MLPIDRIPPARSAIPVQVDKSVLIGLRLSIPATAWIWHSQMLSRFVFLPRSVACDRSKMLIAKALLALACFAALGQELHAFSQHASVNKTESNPAEEGGTGAPQFQARHPRYQIASGDGLEILFSPTAEYNQTVSVQPDGYIAMREVGDVYVLGKTIAETREAVSTAYSKILHAPQITVLLKEFEKPHFTATGQVGRPGKYELRSDTTILEALAVAGGMTEKSKDSQVLLLRRISADWVQAKLLDVKAMQKGRIVEVVHLRPGDILFVPQNRISKIKPFLPSYSIGTYLGPGVF